MSRLWRTNWLTCERRAVFCFRQTSQLIFTSTLWQSHRKWISKTSNKLTSQNQIDRNTQPKAWTSCHWASSWVRKCENMRSKKKFSPFSIKRIQVKFVNGQTWCQTYNVRRIWKIVIDIFWSPGTLTPTCQDCTRTSTSRTSSGPGRARWEDGSKTTFWLWEFLKTTPVERFFWKKFWNNPGGGEWTWRGGGGGGRRSWWHVQPWRRQKISF